LSVPFSHAALRYHGAREVCIYCEFSAVIQIFIFTSIFYKQHLINIFYH